MKYGVTMTYYKYVEVEAESIEDAKVKAHSGDWVYEEMLTADDSSFDEIEELGE